MGAIMEYCDYDSGALTNTIMIQEH